MSPTKKRKSTSRAARCGEACGALTAAAESLRALAEEVRDELQLDEESKDGAAFVPPDNESRKAWQAQLDSAEGDAAQGLEALVELRDEMTEMRDNMEEHFSATDRWQRIDQTAGELESALDSSGEEADVPELPAEDAARDAWETFAEALDERADQLEDCAGECEACDFPGMYG